MSHLSEQQGFLMLGAKFPTNNLYQDTILETTLLHQHVSGTTYTN